MSEQNRMDELFLSFTDPNWASRDRDQKLAALQEMENLLADEQGRPPMEVRIFTKEMLQEFGENISGQFDGEALWLNPQYFEESEDDIPGLVMWTGMEALNTVIHEGRHCWQHYVADHPEVPADPKLRTLLRMNFNRYIPPSFDRALYGAQPVEMDARRYAKDLIAELTIRAIANGDGDQSMVRQHMIDLNEEALTLQAVLNNLTVDDLIEVEAIFRDIMLQEEPDCDLEGISMFGEMIELMQNYTGFIDGRPLALPGARDVADDPPEVLDALQRELLDQLRGAPPVRERTDKPAIGMN